MTMSNAEACKITEDYRLDAAFSMNNTWILCKKSFTQCKGRVVKSQVVLDPEC